MHIVTNCSTALIRLINKETAEEQASWKFVEKLASEKSGKCTGRQKKKTSDGKVTSLQQTEE